MAEKAKKQAEKPQDLDNLDMEEKTQRILGVHKRRNFPSP
jgi:hypothetical protein